MDRYLYAYSNPTVFIDLMGYESIIPYMVDPSLNKAKRLTFNRGPIQQMMEEDPFRFSDELHENEKLLLDAINEQRKASGHKDAWVYNAKDFTKKQLKEAKALFGDVEDAASRYANWLNRDYISYFLFANSLPYRAYKEGQYDLARILDPPLNVADASYRLIEGKHMLSGEPVSREDAAAELVLTFTAFKVAKVGLQAKAAMTKDIATSGINTTKTGGKYLTKSIQEQYVGEETGSVWGSKVKYLTEAERQAYKITVKNGKLYDSTNKLFDTSQASSVFAGGEGKAIFVMDETGNIYASTQQIVGKFHHSSFLAGQPVSAAGEITAQDGMIKAITKRSGHYLPESKYTDQFIKELSLRGVDVKKIKIGSGF